MVMYVNGDNMHTVYVNGEEYYRAYVNGEFVYAKGILSFNLNAGDASISGSSSMYIGYQDGHDGTGPSASRPRYDFLGWFTDPDGGDEIGEGSIDDVGGYYQSGGVPGYTLYAHGKKRTVSVYFTDNDSIDSHISYRLPSSFEVDMGTSFDDALDGKSVSAVLPAGFGYPVLAGDSEAHQGNSSVNLGFVGGEISSGSLSREGTIEEDITVYPLIGDFYIKVTEADGKDLEYGGCNGSGGYAKVYSYNGSDYQAVSIFYDD